MKRLSYLLIILSVVAAVVLVGYFLRFRASEPTSQGEPAPGGLPTIPGQPIAQPPAAEEPSEPSPEIVRPDERKFGVIAQNPVLDFFVDESNSAILVQPNGQIIKIVRGEASTLSSSAINNLRSAKFSYDGKKILAAFGTAQNLQHSIFDVENKSWSPLPSGIESVAWSPANHQIAYFREVGGVKILETLNIADAKARPQELMRINAEDLIISWILPNQMILSEKGSVLLPSSLWSFDVQGRRISRFVEELPGLSSVWSGKAANGLVFSANAGRRGGLLTLYDTTGKALVNLSFLSLPSKCVFDVIAGNGTSTAASKFLYCAIPLNTEQMENASLPDDYEKRSVFTRDGFFAVNLASGEIKEMMTGQFVDGNNLKVFGKNLFFVNRLDRRLYAISLE